MPLGSLLVGAVSQHIGAPTTVLGQGIIGLIIAAAFAKFLTKKLTQPPLDDMTVTEEIISEL
jgi:hypothetical protein